MATKKRQFDKGALDDLLADLGGGAGEEPQAPPAPKKEPKHGKKAEAPKPQPKPAARPVAGRKLTGANLRTEMEKTKAKLAPEPEGAAPAGRAASLRGQKGVQGEPPLTVIVADPGGEIHPKHHPKKHPPGSLTRGTSVWYRGERFWVEYAPSTWTKGCFARISNKPVHPDVSRPLPSDAPSKDLVTFCVHCDLLDLAPQARNIYAPQPSRADIARKERAKSGERDVGDEVAVLLRECKSLDDVYRAGAEFLAVPEQELRTKYGHLNPGQQRMNIGNRMRAKWRKDNGQA